LAVHSLTILPNGYLTLDRSILIAGTDIGVKLQVPVYSVLLMHDEGPILIDTGLHPEALTDPEKAWGPRARLIRPAMTAEDVIVSRLQALHIEPSTVRMVILTHMHWDHTGGLKYFTHCPVVVQKAELRFAFAPDTFVAGQYMRNHFDLPVHYEQIEGDQMLLPGVSVVKTAGHSPGHQSVIVKLRSGASYVIAGDAVSTLDNVRLKIPGSNVWSAELAADSISRLEHLTSLLGAGLFPSHDGERWKEYRTAPACYE
jgi:N-acyl homoserine lactone hydrolase